METFCPYHQEPGTQDCGVFCLLNAEAYIIKGNDPRTACLVPVEPALRRRFLVDVALGRGVGAAYTVTDGSCSMTSLPVAEHRVAKPDLAGQVERLQAQLNQITEVSAFD